ncbi:uncharacterized protein B0H64DRAFT_148129 [Chaetomium fimeti]|uniref:Uncharacterized protein n=1 Tax=Chaetomium fimeti TaxID=1854472 RepID=A0AAE0LST5_9PEZI|nr:hypothetical protein B0H64DRAFT_148129 [Chaetomium fimeti]
MVLGDEPQWLTGPAELAEEPNSQGSVAPSAPSRSVCASPSNPEIPRYFVAGVKVSVRPGDSDGFMVLPRAGITDCVPVLNNLVSFPKTQGATGGWLRGPPSALPDFPSFKDCSLEPEISSWPAKRKQGLDCQRLTKEGQSAISSGIRSRCWFPSAHHQHLSDGAVIRPFDREETGSPHLVLHNAPGNAHRLGCGPAVRCDRCDHFAKGKQLPSPNAPGCSFGAGGEVGWLQRNRRFLGEGLHPQSRANVASNRLRLPPRISAAICWQADGHRARNFRGRKFSSSKQEQRRQPRAARSGQVQSTLGISQFLGQVTVSNAAEHRPVAAPPTVMDEAGGIAKS